MGNLTMKQKIILGLIICAMIIVIGIYGYSSLNTEEDNFNIGDSEELYNEEENNNKIEENIESVETNNDSNRR